MWIEPWENFREKYFDAWAEKYGVTYPEVEGVDYEVNSTYGKCYSAFQIRKSLQDKKRDWLKTSLETKPIRYFLFYGLPQSVEFFLYDIPYMINRWYWWIRYRTFDRYHILDLKLKPRYYEAPTIIEAALWTVLVDFVEGEAAWKTIICDENRDELVKEYKKRNGRWPEKGLEHLDYYINITEEYWTEHRRNGYKKVKQAYLYYTIEKPKLQAELEKFWDDSEGVYEEELERTGHIDRNSQWWKNIRIEDKLERNIYKQDSKHLKLLIEGRDQMTT